MFKPSNMLLKYMDAQPRDRYDIVGALIGYINADPHFGTNDFEDAVDYVLKHGVTKAELFEDFTPDLEYIEDSSKWDEEYYSYAVAYLKDNFCKERIEHVKSVAHKLYPIQKQMSLNPVHSERSGSDAIDNNNRNRGHETSTKKAKDQQDSQRDISTTPKTVSTRDIIIIIIVMLVIVAIVFIIKDA